MSVSVFFSNKNIQVVVGKSKGRSVYIDCLIEVPMPENAILNGVVVEGGDEAISASLKEIWSVNKLKGSADLVINSPQFISNRLTMPIISNIGKASDYIEKHAGSADEFDRFNSPLKGWYLVSTDKSEKSQLVISEVAERSFIEKYIRIFSDAGITLNSVHDGVSLATEMLSYCIGNATAIYMIRDAQMLVTILYEKGKYYYNSTRRIFQQPGTDEFAAEIRSTISGIRQFANSQHISSAITDVYFAGLSPEDVGLLQSYLSDAESDITVHGTVAPSHIHFRKWNDRFSSFIYPVAGLLSPKNGLPILRVIRHGSEDYAKKREFASKAVPVAVFTLILTLITVFLAVVSVSRSAYLKQLNSYNSDPEVIRSAMEYDRMLVRSYDMGLNQGGIDIFEKALSSYPSPDSSVNKLMLDCARDEGVELEFNSYDSASGIFSVTASAYEVEKINKFIAKLLSMEAFQDVDYTGYEWNEENGTWSIKVICSLAEGKEDN